MITNRRVLKQLAYEQALNPPKKPVTAEQFEQIIYDAVARDKTQPREAIVRWAHRNYEVSKEKLGCTEEPASSLISVHGANEPERDGGATGRDTHRQQSGVPVGESRTAGRAPDRASAVFHQYDGKVTKAYYQELEKLGPIGLVAMNLFRASKTSGRAKVYRRRSSSHSAYDVKQYSLECLSSILTENASKLGITWGWLEDPTVLFGERTSFVFYCDLPGGRGQCSFHSPTRGKGPDYPGKWDGVKNAVEGRILAFCDAVMENAG